MIVGRNIPVSEMNMATCCEAVEAEINNPKARQVNVKRMLSKINKNKFL